MTKMHENELKIDKNLVHSLIKSQCPHLANLPLESVISNGTDHALFRIGNDYIVRLPRIDWAAESIDKECEWIPKISKFLTVPISEPLFKGKSNNLYPWSWSVIKWNKGYNPNFEQDNEYKLLAKDLACFLNELHAIKSPGGPLSRRGVPLNAVNEETKKSINELEGEVDIQFMASLWEQLSNLPAWDKKPVWIHGDFLPGNILIQNNRLSAVIDFSDLGIGDPACDLIIAWSLFKPHSREIFRENLENIDDNTWERGRGWALSIALIILPYYKNTNPYLASLARKIIQNVTHK